MLQNNQLIGFGTSGKSLPSYFLTDLAETSGSGNWTFPDVDLGTPHDSRMILVGIQMDSGTKNRPVTSLTVGGITATPIIKAEAQGAIYARYAEWWQASVPDGEIGDVHVITASHTPIELIILTYAVYNLTSVVPTAFVKDTSLPLSKVINVHENGLCFGITCTDDTVEHSWTGLTEDFDENLVGNVHMSSAAKLFSSAQPGLDVSCYTNHTGSRQAMVVVSFK